jgi:hypothetical protein
VSKATPELIERMKVHKGGLLDLTRAKASEQRTRDPVSISPTLDRPEGDPISSLGESDILLPEQVQVTAGKQVVNNATFSDPGRKSSDGPSANFSQPIAFEFWDGQQLRSQRDKPIAIDVETEVIADERTVPRLAIVTATDGNQRVVLHPDQLGDFLEMHPMECFVGHNVQFDFWVIDEHLRRSRHTAQRVLWEACNDGRLRDSMVLDMLIQLATGKYRTIKRRSGKSDTKVYPGNLAEVATEYTAIRISKDDPHRTRFGELVGLSENALREVDPAFFQYAIRDVVATHALYPALVETARSLMLEYGYSESATRFDIRPDSLERFGHLSEIVQVKASIVLSHMFRRGVQVNQAGVRSLTQRYGDRIAELTNEIRDRYPDVLTYDKSGKMKMTPKGKTPSFGHEKLVAALERVAEEIREQGRPMEIPLSKGKKPGISMSVKDWQKYEHLHPFLKMWSDLKRLEKLLGFLGKLNSPTLHCQYGLLTRTGRTACFEPRAAELPGVNLQQIPKCPEFRGLFVPRSSGHQLFIADYSAIELRTLGAVCRAKFGDSKLADVIEKGLDPHAFTAAAIQRIPLDEFLALKTTDPDRFRKGRQAAKAINFGVPGGLGAKTLRTYAETNYGVSLTEDDAKAFRSKLISGVYPELNDRNGYLADTSMAALARNLGLPESLVWRTFDSSGRRKAIAARGVSNVIRGRSTASPGYQAKVWDGLQQLVLAAPKVDDSVTLAVREKHGSPELHGQLYHQKVATLTGRIRDGVGFTESKNTPFQSLAADGAKLALWSMLYAGFDVYGFIHDEIIVDLPSDCTEQDAPRIKDVMERSMEEVLGGIPAACEWTLSDCWAKPD